MGKTAKLTYLQRFNLAQDFKTGKFTYVSLGKKYSCTRQVAKRWAQEGNKLKPNFFNKKGQGRKRKLTPAQQAHLRERIKNHETAKQLAACFNKNDGLHVSLRTVQRTVHGGRFPFCYKTVVQGKVLREENRLLRIEFCSKLGTFDPRHWVFIDAKYLYLYRDNKPRRHRVWQRLDEPPPVHAARAPTVFLFYGAVAYGRKSPLYFVPPTPALGKNTTKCGENFASRHFCEMLDKLKDTLQAWYPDGDYTLIMDHASQHDSAESKAKLQELGLPRLYDFPAQSWDLNIIEKAWALMDGNLEGHRARTTMGWRAHIERAWAGVKDSSIKALVMSVPHRIAWVAEHEGVWPSNKYAP